MLLDDDLPGARASAYHLAKGRERQIELLGFSHDEIGDVLADGRAR